MSASQYSYLQNAATVNGNGTVLDLSGVTDSGKVLLEVRETAGGTATLTLQAAFDGGFANTYAPAYQRVDNQATLTRAVAAISVTANLTAVFQLIELYPQIRAVLSASTGSTVTVRAYVLP